MPAHTTPEVLHYVGYDDDRGGIISVIHALAATGRFRCVLGVNPGCVQHRAPPLPVIELSRLVGEESGPLNFWRARIVARTVQAWLQADAGRVYHGHSRAGLLVGLWLQRFGERRLVVSVHCYGRQRWFYRWAARWLGDRLFWLSPAMRNYYGVTGSGWAQCIPGGVPEEYGRMSPAQPEAGRLRLGGAGALVRWKRWNLVLEALALLPPEVRSQVSFEHIGSAPSDADSTACAVDLRKQTTAGVVWHGAESSSARLLQSIDVYVTASHQEPFSMAMQEALAAGVPVLAANTGGATDLIVSGQNGWLFRDGDAQALAESLEKLVQTRAWTALDRTRVRQSAHLASDVAERWREIYAQL